MTITARQVVPTILLALLAWRVYARLRRNIGRQPFHPGRLTVSVTLFSVVVVLFSLGGLAHPPVLAALAGGLALAIPIALYGLTLTRFEDTPQGKFYTPNTALGLGVSVLFLGRLAYRFFVLHAAPGLQTVQAQPPFQSPLTYFLFGLSAGYFIVYQSGLLLRHRRPAPAT
jgi:hypothetical protein